MEWSSQSYGFSSSVYGCESWTIRKDEHLRIDAFELWCWYRGHAVGFQGSRRPLWVLGESMRTDGLGLSVGDE